ncbi:unnamed protein product [Dovyalis caffra]|uniref:Uncharacterized protein n=1 Tax=Dovyalis caffra TaxID=77055 RepID=A0AAV1RT82_9ROSI|nr:unnamed protein product [Dovyalis caffra]
MLSIGFDHYGIEMKATKKDGLGTLIYGQSGLAILVHGFPSIVGLGWGKPSERRLLGFVVGEDGRQNATISV